MSLKNKVFAELKAKAKSFGFSKKELESAAATIADNLDLDENASDEEIATAATEAVDKYLPLLKLSQSAYGRMVKAYKDSTLLMTIRMIPMTMMTMTKQRVSVSQPLKG